MDNKKLIKDFINNICDWIEVEYKNKGHTGFSYELRNDKLGYLIADKGIEKRIEKQIFKRLNLKSKVEYSTYPFTCNEYINGEIKIKLYENSKGEGIYNDIK